MTLQLLYAKVKYKYKKRMVQSRIWKSTGRFDILLLFLLSTSYIRQPRRIFSISKTHPKISLFIFAMLLYIYLENFFFLTHTFYYHCFNFFFIFNNVQKYILNYLLQVKQSLMQRLTV